MQKILGVIIATLFFVAVVWAGSESWKKKPYQQWTSSEADEILNDSPWSKVVEVEAGWRGQPSVLSNVVDQAGETQTSMPMGGTEEAPGERGGMGGKNYGSPRGMNGPGGDAETLGPSAPVAKFLVRWNSARMIRKAWARWLILKGKLTEAEAEKALAQPVTEYSVLVAGPDMSPFEKVEEGTLKAEAYIRMRKDKRIAPNRVAIQRTQDGKKVVDLVFFFSEKQPNGDPTIGHDDKKVEFYCPVGKEKLKAEFDTKKMLDSKGLDL